MDQFGDLAHALVKEAEGVGVGEHEAGHIVIDGLTEGIEIDHCPQCRGVWLDRGELELPSPEEFALELKLFEASPAWTIEGCTLVTFDLSFTRGLRLSGLDTTCLSDDALSGLSARLAGALARLAGDAIVRFHSVEAWKATEARSTTSAVHSRTVSLSR